MRIRKSWKHLIVGVASALPLIFLVPTRANGRAVNIVDVTVDAAKPIGKIKPLHDLHDGPLNFLGFVDVSHFYRELGVHNVRLSWPIAYGKSVQTLGIVFPNSEADPERPESYEFSLTDRYLQSITDLRLNVIYGLFGAASAEHSPDRYPRLDPPKSYERWADMVSHIARHYNDGWSNGPDYKIKYWEVWNEPDSSLFWTGTAQDYYQLYEIAAKKLKATVPNIKVGGPALDGDLEFLDGFLRRCQEHGVPLDFVSWHYYSPDPHEAAKRGRRIRELIDRHGFSGTESILDEWNYAPPAPTRPTTMGGWTGILDEPGNWQAKTAYSDLIRSEFGAAYDATMLIELQDASVDVAVYYTGTTMFLGMFTQHGGPTKAYYSFLAFRNLLDSPDRVSSHAIGKGDVAVVAGLSDSRTTLRILLSSIDREKHSLNFHLQNLPWRGASHYKIDLIDRNSNLTRVKAGKKLRSKSHISFATEGPSVLLLTISADSSPL
jgi:hypothetical protein